MEKNIKRVTTDSVLYVPSCFDNLLVEETGPEDHKSYKMVRDVKYLLDKEHADMLTPDIITDWKARLNTPTPKRPHMSDKDLMLSCKSRYIQTPSEMMQWMEQLDYESNYLKESYKYETTNNIADTKSESQGNTDTNISTDN